MIEIVIKNTETVLNNLNSVGINLISDLLSFDVAGAEFSNNPYWDGKKRLFDKKTKSFPTGLLYKVLEFFDNEGIEYKVLERRISPTKEYDFHLKEDLVPRDYQLTALKTTQENPRGVINLATGGGKSILSTLVVADKGVETLFVTPDTGLREQLHSTYKNFITNVRIGKSTKHDLPIVVSNIQSLIKRPESDFERFKMLIIDEFHHSSAESYLWLNRVCKNAYYRYGLTGTFMRTDGTDMTMHGVLSNVLFKKTASELIEEGWLARPLIEIRHLQVKGYSRLNYQRAYNSIIEDNLLNDDIVSLAHQKANEEGKHTLILTRRVAHAEALAERIPNAVLLKGTHDSYYREQVKEDFAKGVFKCLVATGILGEGQDLPAIDVLINGRLQKTEIQTMQGIGRALRKKLPKDVEEEVEVYDYWISGQKHLKDHSAERLKSYRKESAFKISVVKVN